MPISRRSASCATRLASTVETCCRSAADRNDDQGGTDVGLEAHHRGHTRTRGDTQRREREREKYIMRWGTRVCVCAQGGSLHTSFDRPCRQLRALRHMPPPPNRAHPRTMPPLLPRLRVASSGSCPHALASKSFRTPLPCGHGEGALPAPQARKCPPTTYVRRSIIKYGSTMTPDAQYESSIRVSGTRLLDSPRYY